MTRASLVLAVAISLAGSVAPAQTLRGTLVDAANAPVPGAVVTLLDGGSVVRARALSNERGEFRLVAPAPGTYRARMQRIGYAPAIAEVVLADKQQLARRFVMNGLRILLDTLHVSDRALCDAFSDSATAAFRVWEQIRTAVMATQLTDLAHAFNARMVVYNKTLDAPGRRVLKQQLTLNEQPLSRTWQSLPPERLHTTGYVLTEPDGATNYYAPGLETLLSESFVTDHCFKVEPKGDRMLMSFEPTKLRENTPEIRGTLTLDRKTSELRRMDFRYENISSEQHDEAVGQMEFAHLKDGQWAISKWSIRMPVFERVAPSRSGILHRLVEIHTVGGELALAERNGDTLFARAPLTIQGTVIDSVTGTPVRGADVILQGTTLSARADDRGRFMINNAFPGTYDALVVSTMTDPITSYQLVVTFIDADTPADLYLVPAARNTSIGNSGVFTGWVLEDTTRRAIPLARIETDSGVAVVTNDKGEFRLNNIAPGTNTIRVRRLGYAPTELHLTFAPNQTLVRRILLDKVSVLPEVVTTAEPNRYLRGFDENRKMGLGQFLDREQLDKHDGAMLTQVIQPMRGVYIGNEGGLYKKKAFLESKHNGASMSGGHCYAQVILDGLPVNRPVMGGSNPPWDLNIVSINSLEAVEYYTSAAEIPAKYMGYNTACGVLVLWTRRTIDEVKP